MKIFAQLATEGRICHKKSPGRREAYQGECESGWLKTVALSGHIRSDLCITTGREQSTALLRKTEGVLAVALPEATIKCGQELALVLTNSPQAAGGSGGQDRKRVGANPGCFRARGLVLLYPETAGSPTVRDL